MLTDSGGSGMRKREKPRMSPKFSAWVAWGVGWLDGVMVISLTGNIEEGQA